MRKINLSLTIVLFFMMATLSEGQQPPFIRENFDAFSDWHPLIFPKIERHTKYSIVSENGNSYLKAESDASASGIIFNKTFSIYKYPILRWSWKVMSIFQKGDANKKAGDDYPIRVYVIFEYDPQKASLTERMQYKVAKLLYGQYPPHSSLNYIWANREHKESIITSPYTKKVKLVLVEKGISNIGKWVEEKVNVVEDYKKAFRKLPPEKASIAVMSDADNTGERAIAFIDYIEVLENPQ